MDARALVRLGLVLLLLGTAGASAQSVRRTHVDPACRVCEDTARHVPPSQPELDYESTLDNRLWHLDRLDSETPDDMDGQFRTCVDGTGVRVYVIDTGVMRVHSEFGDTYEEQSARVLGGYDATTVHESERDDLLATNPCSGWPEAISSRQVLGAGHGTSVASLVAGKRVGVAPGATIVPVLVSRCQTASKLAWRPNRLYEAGEQVSIADPDVVQFETMARCVSGPAVPYVPAGTTQISEGSCTWRRAPNPATLHQTEAMARAVNWLRTNIVLPAVVTFSSWASKGTPGYADLDSALATFEAAHPRVPIFASANNQDQAASCEQLPAGRSLGGGRGQVLSVGGSMLRNSPDTHTGARSDENEIGEREPEYDPGRPTRDGRWIVAAGGDSTTATVAGDRGSNYGPCVDLFAPAKNITSARMSGPRDYRDRTASGQTEKYVQQASGTSFAAPMAAGVAARYLQMRPHASREEVYEAIRATAGEGILVTHDLNPSAARPNNNLMLRAADIMFRRQPVPEAAGPGAWRLEAEAYGPPGAALLYQWQHFRDGAWQDVAGQNGPAITVQPAETTLYRVAVTAYCNGETKNVSRVVRLAVDDRCALVRIQGITTEPVGGPRGQVTVDATGAASYAVYRGERGDTRQQVASGTENVLTFPAVEDGRYWVRAIAGGDSSCHANSEAVTVRIQPGVRRDTLPETLPEKGATVSLQPYGDHLVYRWPNGPTTFRWFVNGRLTDCTTTTCTFGSLPAYDPFEIRATIHNELGEVSIEKSVTACRQPYLWGGLPGEPVNVAASPEISLYVTNGPSHVQWYRGYTGDTSHPIHEAWSTILTVPPIIARERFWMRAWTGACFIDSRPVTVDPQCGSLAVVRPPYVYSSTPTETVLLVETTDPNATYAWFRGDETEPFATTQAARVPPVTHGEAYRVRIRSADKHCTITEPLRFKRARACCS